MPAFVRPIYAGNAILTVQSTDPIKLFTIRQTAFPPAEGSGGSASISEGVDPKAPSPTEWVSEDLAVSDRPELATASKVVSGGRGLKSKEEFDRLIPPLADALRCRSRRFPGCGGQRICGQQSASWSDGQECGAAAVSLCGD